MPEQDWLLADGSRVAVIGGGPAGSLFSYFFLETAARIGLEASVDIYEAKDFCKQGPAGCNMCGGIVSESLIQLLTAEGINLPPNVVQRGIDSYVLHMDVGTVRIDPPGHEKRIAAVHRGSGPRGLQRGRWDSFDNHLLGLAQAKGARVVSERVEAVQWREGRPCLATKQGVSEPYDLLTVAAGVNGLGPKLLQALGVNYQGPQTCKTYICEFPLGEDVIERYMGSSMHVFLLDIPRLDFAALVPKGEFVTMCMLGRDIDKEMVSAFLNAPEVRQCFPPGWDLPADHCRCSPAINTGGAPQPFGDRLVFVGDCGESRLYKDGIGGAYRTAKAAAKTAVFEGVSAAAFRKHFQPTCRSLATDNRIGRLIFAVTHLIQHLRFSRRGMFRMVSAEQAGSGRPRLSGVLWDTFTGSAPYRSVLARTTHPLFLGRLAWETAAGFAPALPRLEVKEDIMSSGELGKVYRSGEVIIRQGDPGECMYVIQSGKVEVLRESGGRHVKLAELGEGDFFGEMALFDKDVRSATVRPLGEVRALTIDKRMFLRKIHEDPSLAFRVMQKMSRRIRELDVQLTQLSPAG